MAPLLAVSVVLFYNSYKNTNTWSPWLVVFGKIDLFVWKQGLVLKQQILLLFLWSVTCSAFAFYFSSAGNSPLGSLMLVTDKPENMKQFLFWFCHQD